MSVRYRKNYLLVCLVYVIGKINFDGFKTMWLWSKLQDNHVAYANVLQMQYLYVTHVEHAVYLAFATHVLRICNKFRICSTCISHMQHMSHMQHLYFAYATYVAYATCVLRICNIFRICNTFLQEVIFFKKCPMKYFLMAGPWFLHLWTVWN